MRTHASRVLHVIGGLNVGGAETMLMNLYRHVDRTAVQFDFVVFVQDEGFFESEIRAAGGRIFRLPPPRESGIRRSIKDLQRLIEQTGPYVAVHSHVLHATGWVMLAARLAGVDRRIAHSHNTLDRPDGIRRRSYEGLSRLIVRRAATTWLACGQEAGRFLFGRRFAERGRVLPNSINVETFLPLSPADAALFRAKLGLDSATLAIGSVARLEPVKNHDFLLDVARECRRRGLDVRFFLCGTGTLLKHLENRIRGENLEPYVRILGVRADMPQVLSAMDLLVMPSLFEGLPVSLVEAQTNGLKCLVSEHVTVEADLGLGLMRWLPISDPGTWADQLVTESRQARMPRETLRAAVSARGYEISTAVRLLEDVYEVRP